jgi:enamine deaminase RidA (YjgF/YER057c/UK114 family)
LKRRRKMNKEVVIPRGTKGPLTPAVKVKRSTEWLFIAGTVPRDLSNKVVGPGDIRKQIHQVFSNLRQILEEGGYTFKDLIQLNVYLIDSAFRSIYLEFAQEVFKDNPVAQTVLMIRGLNDPEAMIEIDGIACIP